MTDIHNNSSAESTKKLIKKSTSKRKKNDFDIITSAFRTKFQQQVRHDIATKKAVLETILNEKAIGTYTVDVFKRDVARRITVLMENWRWNHLMHLYNIDPYAAATHYVLLGTQTFEDFILDKSNQSNLQVYAKEWKHPLFDETEMCSYEHSLGNLTTVEFLKYRTEEIKEYLQNVKDEELQ